MYLSEPIDWYACDDIGPLSRSLACWLVNEIFCFLRGHVFFARLGAPDENPSGTEAKIFREDQVNIMADDALATLRRQDISSHDIDFVE